MSRNVRCETVVNLNLIQCSTGSQCNCWISGSDGEKWGMLIPRMLNNYVHV